MKIGWNFDNTYVTLPSLFYSRLEPVPVKEPELVILNEPLATDLGLDTHALQTAEAVAVLAGNAVPPGADPLAQAYAGHQFGGFTMLGDGRAILLGEQVTPDGRRFDIQLKGSGQTPYSRRGDGRAALGPMLREYIVSEAMHALDIPTTRSLAVVKTGEWIARETWLPGAVLTRVAASHLRVGTFQYARRMGDMEALLALADYALARHDADVDLGDPQRFLRLLERVMERQAELIVGWQLVGFIHGVMNTDNMTISGETIDYGPCAFMDAYDPNTVFSSIDREGRYQYGNQPTIASWNLARFAETLLPLLDEDEKRAIDIAQEAISRFPDMYRSRWLKGMRNKLGLFNEEEHDLDLVTDLLDVMYNESADFTNTFRNLTISVKQAEAAAAKGAGADLQLTVPTLPVTERDPEKVSTPAWTKWLRRWRARLERQPQTGAEVYGLMKKTNPAVIPRNHRVEEALAAAVDAGDLEPLERLLAVLADPFAYSPEQESYTTPDDATRPYVTFCGT